MAALRYACSAFRYGWVGDDARTFGPQQWDRPVGERELICYRKHPRCHRGQLSRRANSPGLAIKHQQAAEQVRERGEVLAHQLASSRWDVGTLTARVTALTDMGSGADRALLTAQSGVAEQE